MTPSSGMELDNVLNGGSGNDHLEAGDGNDFLLGVMAVILLKVGLAMTR